MMTTAFLKVLTKAWLSVPVCKANPLFRCRSFTSPPADRDVGTHLPSLVQHLLVRLPAVAVSSVV